MPDRPGRYDGTGAPIFIHGETEIDFEKLDEQAMRKLFVGATRATHKLLFVMLERAAQMLLQRLS